MKFTYTGPFDEVEIPSLGITVKQGSSVEITDSEAIKNLSDQDVWKRQAAKGSGKPAKKAAATEPEAAPADDEQKKES